MKTFLNLIKLDLKLLIKYNLLTVSIFVSSIYIAIFKIFNLGDYSPLVSALVFSDPAMIGFIFIGVMILYEKSQNTLQALSVCPINFENYIWSKALSLTILALPICFSIVFSSKGFDINYFALIPAITFSSLLFALLGFIGVTKVNTFNQYIIVIPLFFAPAIIPMFNLFDVWYHPFFYLIPTHASLLLFKATFEEISLFDWIYSITYLIVWIIIARYFALKAYRKNITSH